MANSKTLTRDGWANGALELIAAGGVDAVSVERLARDLGVTKGSFYWHFTDRAALIAAALELWERTSTLDIIEAVGVVTDPSARLRRLAEVALGGKLNGPVDVALLARADHPSVAPVVERVTRTRLGFIEDALRELGWPPVAAANQARIAYAAYVGHFVVRRSLPDDVHLRRPSARYLRQFVDSVAPPWK